LPLRLATLLGFVMALFGTVVLAYVLGQFLTHGSVPGFPFLACIVSLFSGAQLLAVGIIGEYLGRIFLRSMGRPNYAIKEVAGPVSAEATERHQ
jgi:undecaprenyl-phosphate 4-deoxy-4-formamido-L-arabinose transferase